MASENDIADLVEASDKLTKAVEGKIAEIDNKLNQSISELNAEFPIVYSKYTKLTHYIDPVNGNDDNDGSNWVNAVKTIKRVLELGGGALQQYIYASVGKYVIDTDLYALADYVYFIGHNQNHYPDGNYSESESSILNIDKTDIGTQFGVGSGKTLFFNRFVFTYSGSTDSTHAENTFFKNSGKLRFRLPLFVFDSVNRGIAMSSNNSVDFSSLGAELPQFSGEAGYVLKGGQATSIVNLDRAIDRTTGINMAYGSVTVLT